MGCGRSARVSHATCRTIRSSAARTCALDASRCLVSSVSSSSSVRSASRRQQNQYAKTGGSVCVCVWRGCAYVCVQCFFFLVIHNLTHQASQKMYNQHDFWWFFIFEGRRFFLIYIWIIFTILSIIVTLNNLN